MLTATPRYSATTPEREQDRAGADQHHDHHRGPAGHRDRAGQLDDHRGRRRTAARGARTATPRTLTSRSSRVPLVSTIRQKCESRRAQRVARLAPRPPRAARTGQVATGPGDPAQRDVEVDARHPAYAADAARRPRRASAGSCGRSARRVPPPSSRSTTRLAPREAALRSAPCGRLVGRPGVDDGRPARAARRRASRRCRAGRAGRPRRG